MKRAMTIPIILSMNGHVQHVLHACMYFIVTIALLPGLGGRGLGILYHCCFHGEVGLGWCRLEHLARVDWTFCDAASRLHYAVWPIDSWAYLKYRTCSMYWPIHKWYFDNLSTTVCSEMNSCCLWGLYSRFESNNQYLHLSGQWLALAKPEAFEP